MHLDPKFDSIFHSGCTRTHCIALCQEMLLKAKVYSTSGKCLEMKSKTPFFCDFKRHMLCGINIGVVIKNFTESLCLS